MPTPRMDDPQQLSLFDESPAPPASPRADPPPPAMAPPATAAPVASTTFAHPQARRDIQFGEHRVAYALRRARRRSIGFVIGEEGLTVSAPRWVGQGEIESALREKAAWILRKLHEQRERSRKLEASRIEWREGGSLPFLGETVILVLDPRVAGAVLDSGVELGPPRSAFGASPQGAPPADQQSRIRGGRLVAADSSVLGDASAFAQGDRAQTALPGVPRLTLHLGLPHTATPEQIRDRVQSWLQRQARRIFEERCAIYAGRLNVRMKRLSLSSAATRWGSASADGSIRLNWRLVHFGLPVIDYVVTHELAHLREMNHSAAFWEVVRSVLPAYEAARGTLREQVLPALS